MTPTRRRSILVGLALGLVVGVALAYLFGRGGGDSDVAELDPSNTLAMEDGIPVAGDIEGRRLPDQSFEMLDGGRATFADYLGTPLVINVWSSTCAPCVKEMPEFEKAHQELQDRVQFVGVNNQDRVDAARRLADKTGVTYPLLRDPDGAFFAAMELAVMPTTLFVSADGTVKDVEAGALDGDELHQLV